jgi:hypothetical protein
MQLTAGVSPILQMLQVALVTETANSGHSVAAVSCSDRTAQRWASSYKAC